MLVLPKPLQPKLHWEFSHPQFSFKFGDTYGRITHDLLTDLTVRKSPRSVLAPLDNKENLQEFHYHIEHPGYVTYQPIISPPEVPLGPQPVPMPVPEEPTMTHMDPRHWQCPPDPPVPGALQPWQPQEPLQGLALHPAAEEMEVVKSPLAGLLGKGTRTCQCNCGGSKVLETGGVALPGGDAADDTLPVLPVPNAIRQKVIPGLFFGMLSPCGWHCAPGQWKGFRNHLSSLQLWGQAPEGYAGFVPYLFDKVGMTYIPAVKEAMKEFDRYQLLQRNPPYTLGRRFPLTHWPDTKIYSRAGLKPAYAGFVPCLRDLCGLTYGNATRESYRCEQRRRGIALCGILVLLVLRDQVVHVALSLCELHLVHALPCVPVQESLSAEHRSELLRNAFEQLLDGRAVANEGGRHFEAARWNVTDCCLNVIRNPFNKVAAIFVLNIEHLLIHLFHGHAAPKDGGHGQIAAVTRVTCRHHVLGIEHLLGELWHARYCWLPRLVSGAKPGIKKCRRGKGTMFTASFRRSALSWPGNRRQVVTPLMVADTRWFRSP
ncbi:LOW QUALITY PROTEIN: hypothetical protein Nmel_016925 [Mimus melanotis]